MASRPSGIREKGGYCSLPSRLDPESAIGCPDLNSSEAVAAASRYGASWSLLAWRKHRGGGGLHLSLLRLIRLVEPKSKTTPISTATCTIANDDPVPPLAADRRLAKVIMTQVLSS